MKVALYFGSFNPIHLGHLTIAQTVLKQTNCDQLWFIVSPHNPLKEKKELLGEHERLSLIEKAIVGEELMCVSDIEFSLDKPSYTYNTMQALEQKYSNYLFSIVMGGDSFASITKWKNYEELLTKHDIILYRRKGYEIETSLSSRLTILNVPFIDISATVIRMRIKNKKPFRYLVADSVWKELKSKGYYE